MQNKDASRDLELIREMIEDTKRSTMDSWPFLMGWGLLALIACALSAFWAVRQAYPMIGLTWFGFMVVGFVGSVLIGRSIVRTRAFYTFTDKIMSWLWISLGIALFILAFVLPAGGVYPYKAVPLLVAVTIAAGLFFTGGIFAWPMLKFAGVCWWVGALIMIVLPVETYFAILGLLAVIGYLIPGFLMRHQHRKYLTSQHV